MKADDGLAAVSFANLWWLRVWWEVLQPGAAYHASSPVQLVRTYLAVCFNVLLTGMLLWIAVSCVRRIDNAPVRRAAASLAVLALIAILRPHSAEARAATVVGQAMLVGGILLFSATAALIVYWSERARRFTMVGLFVLSPFVLVTFGHAGWSYFHNRAPEAYRAKPNAPWLPVLPGSPRAVWIIFDEMDQRLAIAERPATVQLPELDRFRAEALQANNAFPPGGRATEIAMPALITGHDVGSIEPQSPQEARLAHTNQLFSHEGNVFTDARSAGFNTALVGIYNPYCRVIGQDLTSCSSSLRDLETDKPILRLMWQQWQLTLNRMFKIGIINSPYYPSRARARRRTAIALYNDVLPAVLKAAADARFGLVLIHFPTPHPPGIYDRVSRRFSDSASASYLDNLALMDATLGQIRREMEHSGTWNRSTILISADHSLRPDLHAGQSYWTKEDAASSGGRVDYRVPFLLKFPGKQSAVAYNGSFRTVITRRLLQAILRGVIATPEDAMAWLDKYGADADARAGGPDSAERSVRDEVEGTQ